MFAPSDTFRSKRQWGRGRRSSPWVCPSSTMAASSLCANRRFVHGTSFAQTTSFIQERCEAITPSRRGPRSSYRSSFAGTLCVNTSAAGTTSRRLANVIATSLCLFAGRRLVFRLAALFVLQRDAAFEWLCFGTRGTWTLDIHGDSRVFASTIFGRGLLSVIRHTYGYCRESRASVSCISRFVNTRDWQFERAYDLIILNIL